MQKRKRSQSKGPPRKKAKFVQKDKLLTRYASGLPSGPQLKCVDNSVVSLIPIVNTSQATVPICGISQGDGTAARDGNRVRYKSLEWWSHLWCVPPSSGNYPGATIRWILGYDKQPNGAAVTWADVVQASGPATSQVFDPTNFFYKDRFLILQDQIDNVPGFSCTVAAGAATYTSQSPLINTLMKPEHGYKRLKFILDSKFIGSGSAISNYSQGAFFVVTQSDQFSEGFGPWRYMFRARAIYSDSVTV